MLIQAVMTERLSSTTEKWNHNVNRNSAVYVSRMKNPTHRQWYNSTFAVVDGVACFFMVTRNLDVIRFYYSCEFSKDGKLHREDGDFEGFDSVSGEFRGIRFHWSRESGKVIISDAFARRRDFEALTIE